MSLLSDTMDRTKASWNYKSKEDKARDAAAEATQVVDGEIELVDLRNKLRNPTSAPPTTPTTPSRTSTKCGVICQKKKKRKVLLIGFGVLLVGGISYFILKKK
jgi:hypothetical protein